MSKEICISSTPHETRLAIFEDEQLTEVYYERENEYTLAGSIYKGRVTRVLPGMQSAFVDLGLERDAFLYVTDFMEEQEDSSDFERIPANGRPEEREPQARESQPRENQPRENQGRESRQQRAPRTVVAVEEEGTPRRGGAPVSPAPGGAPSANQASGEEFEDGTRRWRGRRGRRKGSRPQQGGQSGGQQAAQEPAAAIGRTETPVAPTPASEEDLGGRRPAVAFSLPGESLSKYGGQSPAKVSTPQVDSPQQRPNVITSKPSTLIQAPLEWSGEGLLPGESISRYRGSSDEAPASFPSGQAISAPVAQTEHTTLQEETMLAQEEPAALAQQEAEPYEAVYEAMVPEVTVPEAAAPFVAQIQEEAQASPIEESPAVAAVEFEPEEASASHRVDPSAPSEFRFAAPSLNTVEEELPAEAEEYPSIPEFEFAAEERTLHEHTEAGSHEPAVLAAPHPDQAELETDFDELEEDFDASGPETGLVEEEEVTEEEEYDFTPLYADSEDHDLQELEEETLDQEVSAGGQIGEMVRDAHIDQRTNGDASVLTIEDEGEDELEDKLVDEAEEAEGGEAPLAAAPGQPARRPRDDQRRGGRGQRNDGRRRHNGRRQNAQTSDLPIISELLKQGQEILVQIAKEPIAKKGARITSHIALPGRFLVFMPTVNHVGVSRKISSDEERLRLKRILISEKGTVSGGFIVRTAADGASEEDLRADIRFLISLWTEIKQRSDTAKAPALIYHDLNLVERILRDQVSDNFSTIWVDTEAEYERILRFLNRFQPSLVRRVKLYTKETPLFEQFGIQDEITKALKSKVWLKSGGSIVINQTEALVAIDINTGKYVGKTARLEDTILKTNLDAIPEIVRQIRLRDLGGIIVIDFIDMDERKNRNKVMQALEDELKLDRAPSKVLQFNDFGLVAITRKRVKQSLERTLSTQCAICAGTGMVKSPTTVCNEIYTEMRKMQLHLERQDVLLRVHPEVVKTLKLNNARWLNELEEMSGKTIIVKSDPALHPEQFDIH
jgi:ribonuclease E